MFDLNREKYRKVYRELTHRIGRRQTVNKKISNPEKYEMK